LKAKLEIKKLADELGFDRKTDITKSCNDIYNEICQYKVPFQTIFYLIMISPYKKRRKKRAKFSYKLNYYIDSKELSLLKKLLELPYFYRYLRKNDILYLL